MQNTKCSESLASCPVSITLDIASAPLHHRDVNNRTMAMKRPSHGTSASRSHQQKAFGHIGCATRPSQKENLHGIHPPSLTTTTYLCVQLCPCYCLSFVALLSKGRQWCAHANDERPPTASPSSFVALFGRKWTLWVMELLTIQRNPQGPGKKKSTSTSHSCHHLGSICQWIQTFHNVRSPGPALPKHQEVLEATLV